MIFNQISSGNSTFLDALTSKFCISSVELPDEIWLKIIQNLPTKDLFKNFALSCKKFHNFSEDPFAIKHFQVKNINTLPKFENVKKIIAASKALVGFRIIQQDWNFVDELICFTFVSNPRLKNLKIETKTLKAKTINTIVKSNIEVLDLNLEIRDLGLDE